MRRDSWDKSCVGKSWLARAEGFLRLVGELSGGRGIGIQYVLVKELGFKVHYYKRAMLISQNQIGPQGTKLSLMLAGFLTTD